MNVIDFFDRSASLFPDRIALIFRDQYWRYDEVLDLATRIGHGLTASGVGRETKCAVISRNHPHSYIAFVGILKARGTWVPLHTGNAPEENFNLLEIFEAEVLFYSTEFRDFAVAAAQKFPNIRLLVCLDDEGDDGLLSWAARQKRDPIHLPLDPDGLCMLRGTGGTTGRPKGVMNTNRNFEMSIANFLAALKFDRPPVYLAAAPLTHAASVLSLPIVALAGTIIIEERFDPSVVLKAIPRHKISCMFLPPTAIYALLSYNDVRDYDYSSLKYFIYGAAPMSAAKLKDAIDIFGPVMAQAYGQAEAPAGLAFMSPAEHFDDKGKIDEKRLLSCGRPTPFSRVALMNDDGGIVPRGETGEIVAQGGIVMRGYYKNDEATAEVSAHGWHHTGDLAYQDDEGFLYIVDRKKEMIISGGFNIYPLEIEQVILGHVAVEDCAVFGIPDEKWGEAVRAAVELKPGAKVTGQELIDLCKESLGSIKAPKSVEFVDRLPRSPVGKVMRRAVRDRYWVGQERRV